MKVVIGIQARLSSSRLPCKALLPMSNTSVIGLTALRALQTGYETFLLTSTNQEDDLLVNEIQSIPGMKWIRGSLDDVRSRFSTLSSQTKCDFIVRVTGDNPFTDFRFIDPLIYSLVRTQSAYSWVNPYLCPDGTNLEVFSSSILDLSLKKSASKLDQEHVTPWIRENTKNPNASIRMHPIDSCCYHLGIDTIDDYVKLRLLLDASGLGPSLVDSLDTLDDLVRAMIESPDFPEGRRHKP